jgi:hypothetical protein
MMKASARHIAAEVRSAQGMPARRKTPTTAQVEPMIDQQQTTT